MKLFLPLTVLAVLPAVFFTIGCSRSTSYEVYESPRVQERDDYNSPRFADAEARGQDRRGERYSTLADNPSVHVSDQPLSTFSVDVDTASYANVRRYLQNHQMPPVDAVRVEEMVNYFQYAYPQPERNEVLHVDIEVAECPWRAESRLVRIGVQGKQLEMEERPPANLVFLLDVSGSMLGHDRLPLLKQGLSNMLTGLNQEDRIAIVVYAGASGLVLPSTPATRTREIRRAIGQLQAGGSTNGGQGIQLAYEIAKDNYIESGINRVILATDGDFNVGTTTESALVRLVERQAKSNVFLTVLGFGRGNLNDSMMERISNHGNGNYAYIDSLQEAQRVLVDQVSGTLMTIAKDVKIQVEFNPALVDSYRLVGYENRMLATRDFDDDRKDAGEVGAGHQVTAIYEISPTSDAAVEPTPTGSLFFQPSKEKRSQADRGDLLLVKIRYKASDGTESRLRTFACRNEVRTFSEASSEFQFATAVAEFGMLLRNSNHVGALDYGTVLEHATMGHTADARSVRQEFLELVQTAKRLTSNRFARY